MTLDAWLTSKEMTDSAFAVLVDRYPSTVSRWRSGQVAPDWISMRRILEVTDLQVTPNDFAVALADPAPEPQTEAAE